MQARHGGAEAADGAAGELEDGGVEDGRVLALQEADLRHLAGAHHVDAGQLAQDDVADTRLLVEMVVDGREDARHDDGIDAFFLDHGTLLDDLLLPDGGLLRAVDVQTAVDVGEVAVHDPLEGGGEVGEGGHLAREGLGQAQDGHFGQATGVVLDDGVDEVGGADGEAADLVGRHAGLLEHGAHGGLDAVGDIGTGGWGLVPGDDPAVRRLGRQGV
ncbi:hypothetical protein VTK73DRAFT_10342 [Phialemonium thermophilum]|uniref:Uncharacterized protein n=1 Tax=Phialemonium thermophilum TaxID=223376 RepID=A0ABR3VX71_9PEZI